MKNKKKIWECDHPFPLTCWNHGENISVSCGRWKTCTGCRIRKTMELRNRFLAGIEHVPEGRVADFFTLTFPRHRAPSEDEAQAAFRSLVFRLRYRGYLGEYGWVLQRQSNGCGNRATMTKNGVLPGTLHFHGIAHLDWFEDDLEEWGALVEKSGFGSQHDLTIAEPKHAFYIARYISRELARLAPVRRAFSFSRGFPRSAYELERAREREHKRLLRELGVRPEHEYAPTSVVLAEIES